MLDRVHTWPKDRQEDAARLLLSIEAGGTAPYALSAEERSDLEAALAEIDSGDLASEADVESAFRRGG